MLLNDIDARRHGNHGYLSVMPEDPTDTLAVGHLMQHLPGLKAFMGPTEVKRLHVNSGKLMTQHKPDTMKDSRSKHDRTASSSKDHKRGRSSHDSRTGDKSSKETRNRLHVTKGQRTIDAITARRITEQRIAPRRSYGLRQ